MTARPQLAAVADIPRLHARQRPGAVAMVYDGRSTSYGALDRHASQVANGLIAEGVRPQARIAQLDKNSDIFFELLFGSTKANAVLVSVNWRLAPPEIAYVINDARAEILFVGEEFFPAIEKIRHELKTVRKIIAFNGKHAQWGGFEAWRDSFPDRDPMVPVAPQDTAIQLYTSGTTGHPKGVQITNANFTWMMPLWADSWLLNPGARNLVCMPAFHIGGAGWGMVGMYGGATNYIFREFVPAQILQAIEKERIEVALLVPAMILFLLQAPQIRETDLSSLKIIVYGAAPMPVEVMREALKTLK
jgi:acyl-CoA synthetase (AMP-forming)/AMP-acid ligase II